MVNLLIKQSCNNIQSVRRHEDLELNWNGRADGDGDAIEDVDLREMLVSWVHPKVEFMQGVLLHMVQAHLLRY